MTSGGLLVIAHRTCPRHAPENSLEGIRRAGELGAGAVEVDVRLTRDGVPVLLHDPTPRRTTGGWLPARFTPVRRSTAGRLAGLRLSNGEPIPTLAAALGALAPGLRIAIDVKAPEAMAATVAEVRNQGLAGRALLWAQDAASVRYGAEHAPDMEPALLRDTASPHDRARFLADATGNGARAVSADWDSVTPAFAEQARERDLLLYSWCRRSDPEPEKVALLDGIVTDWPDTVRAGLGRRG